jgi:Zn-dependent M28 family amino/carboxypeptidase
VCRPDRGAPTWRGSLASADALAEHGFAGPNDSGTIEQVFKDFLEEPGLAYETIAFDGRTDYDAFTTAGIPAGGIFAGAEGVRTPDRGRCCHRATSIHRSKPVPPRKSVVTDWPALGCTSRQQQLPGFQPS